MNPLPDRWRELAMQILRKILAFVLLALSTASALSLESLSERAWVEDPSGTMTLDQVKAAPQRPLTGPYFGQGFSASAFWIRLRIDPSQWPDAQPDTELVIRMKPVNFDEFQLHDPLAPGGEVRYTGDRHSWALDDYQSLNHNFVIPLGHEPRDVWLRLQTSTSTYSIIEVLEMKAARHKDFKQMLWSLVYVSVLLICMAWGILSWLNSRDPLVGLYVIREFFMIAYATVIFGFWRALGAEVLTPEWIDTIANVGFLASVLVIIWFDVRFLSEFKPHGYLINALYGILFIFCGLLLIGIWGYGQWVLKIQALMLALYFVTALMAAATTRIWADIDEKTRPVVSKTVLVAYYLFVLVIGVFNRLVASDVLPSFLDIATLLMVYPLMGSVMMMVLLQLRARQQYKLQQQAQWRVELAERSAEEEKAKREEQQRFLAMLGHELRNPLAAVNLLADTSTPEGQKIRRTVQEMTLVIERSLQAERLDEGLKPHVEATDLTALLQKVTQRVASPRLQLRTRDLPALVQTDRVLLSVVLGNLVDNALKYSPEGSTVRLQAELLGGHQVPTVRFCVSNSVGAAGMPDENQLFEKYYRNPAAQYQIGSGLGLYLVRGLVGALGGSINYRPWSSGGSQQIDFEVQLPVFATPSLAA